MQRNNNPGAPDRPVRAGLTGFGFSLLATVVLATVSLVVLLQESHPSQLSWLRQDISEEYVDLIVKYKSEEGYQAILQAAGSTTQEDVELKRFHKLGPVVKVRVPRASTARWLQEHPEIYYATPEQYYHATSFMETGLYGIQRVQGGRFSQTRSFNRTTTGCNNDDSLVRIAVIDGGLDATHPEFQHLCGDVNDEQTTRCVGRNFGSGITNEWYMPGGYSHGTHVSGTIGGATTGVIQDGGFCLIIGRIFGENGSAGFESIYDAVFWATEVQNATIVNLSLGGNNPDPPSEELYNILRQEGKIIVAAAGNTGRREEQYPASYESVLSIGATDRNNNLYDFSTRNDNVDLVAPGVEVLSAVSMDSEDAITSLKVDGENYLLDLMTFSALPQGEITGRLVDCGYGTTTCPGGPNQICLIERGDPFDGTTTFLTKATSCESGGGIAAVVYNNAEGSFRGTLSRDSTVEIPVFSMSDSDGNTLKLNKLNTLASFDVLSGYMKMTGTSMSTPHVTGVAGLLWRSCPLCTNEEIISCMLSSAFDLGDPLRDESFGEGLVQSNSAYACLADVCCPDAELQEEETFPSESPVSSPTSSSCRTDDAVCASSADCCGTSVCLSGVCASWKAEFGYDRVASKSTVSFALFGNYFDLNSRRHLRSKRAVRGDSVPA